MEQTADAVPEGNVSQSFSWPLSWHLFTAATSRASVGLAVRGRFRREGIAGEIRSDSTHCNWQIHYHN